MALFKIRSIDNQDIETLRQFKRLKNGERKAFDYFFQKTYKYIFYYCRNLFEYDDAENCTARVFVRLWKQKQHLNFSSVGTVQDQMNQYLFDTARSECFTLVRLRDEVNAEERIKEFTKETEYFEKLAILRALFEESLKKKIAALPDFLKTVVKLAFYERRSNKQIAEELKISEGNVIEAKKQVLEALGLRNIQIN